jgi:MFS family permease
VSRFRTGLWRDPDFLRLWAAQTISTFGSLVAGLALSFLAITSLDATPAQLSLLGVAGLVPAFVAGPLVGVLVDRVHRRPVMVTADLARAVVLSSIPLAAVADALSMGLLYGVAALLGVLSLSFDVANRAHLPWLVSRPSLTEANSKLTGGGSVAEAAAFASAGWLVQWLTAPVVFVINALTMVWSAIFVSRIEKPEPVPAGNEAHPQVLTEFVDGLRYVARHTVLRALLGSSLVFNLFTNLLGTLYIYYVLEEIGFSEGISGVAFALGGGGALLGAVVASRITRRLGVGRAIIAALVVAALANLLVPLSTDATLFAFGLILLQQFLGDAAWTVYEIADTSLVQVSAGDEWQGRVQATMRMTQFGGQLLGTGLAGVLPLLMSVRETMFIAAAGMALAAVPILFSNVLRLRDVPVIEEDGDLAAAREVSEAGVGVR